VLTDRAPAGEFEPVQCLGRAERRALPDELRLWLQERLVTNGQAKMAARPSSEQAAAQLSADAAARTTISP
jgi:hypothetical protein